MDVCRLFYTSFAWNTVCLWDQWIYQGTLSQSFLQVLEKSKLLRKKAVYLMTSIAFVFNTFIGMHVKYRNATTQVHFWQVSVYSHKKEDQSTWSTQHNYALPLWKRESLSTSKPFWLYLNIEANSTINISLHNSKDQQIFHIFNIWPFDKNWQASFYIQIREIMLLIPVQQESWNYIIYINF